MKVQRFSIRMKTLHFIFKENNNTTFLFVLNVYLKTKVQSYNKQTN